MPYILSNSNRLQAIKYSKIYKYIKYINTNIGVYLFIFIFLIFKLYIIVLVLPNIKMNPPQVYMCSPS